MSREKNPGLDALTLSSMHPALNSNSIGFGAFGFSGGGSKLQSFMPNFPSRTFSDPTVHAPMPTTTSVDANATSTKLRIVPTDHRRRRRSSRYSSLVGASHAT
jgi:hypothetical protein